ncbi:MAG: hypothetical protein E7635_04645 [Ruminococcaceae bacterium]|nr:hypothetical protein [Oscillospiraceae bacterium]
MLKKIVSVLLVIVMVASMSACESDDYAMKYNNTTISENEYLYWLSSYKAVFLTYYLNGNDSQEVWSSELSDGITVEQFLSEIAKENIKNNIVCIDLFDSLGLKLDKTAINESDTYINSLKETAGGADALNSALSAYGVNDKMLKDIYKTDLKIKAAQDALFAEGGELEITEEEKKNHFKKNYVRVKHIYINNVKDFARDDEGDLIIDSETGTYKTRDLTEAEKAEKNTLGELIYSDVLAGGDFDILMQENTADTYMNIYKDGYFVTSNSAFLPSPLIEKAFEMADGEIAKIDSEIGIHIIKRESLIDGAYNDSNNAVFFSEFDSTIKNMKMSEYLSALTPDVIINEDVIGAFDLRSCTPNYSY